MGEIDVFKKGVPRSVRYWGAYVAQHKRPAPFLNALDDKKCRSGFQETLCVG